MKQYIAFPLAAEKDSVVVVEVDEREEGGYERAARAPELAQKVGETFEAALEKIGPITRAVIAKLRSLSDNVTEVDVEFGLKMDAKAGVLLASGGVEANFKVSLKWKRKEA
jgi:hypothetical protein